MIVVGIDPGTRRLGWGVVRREGTRLRHVAHGVIRLDERAALGVRLGRIHTELDRVLSEYRPAVGSVETLFFHKDAQAAAKLGHARGVVLFTLDRVGVEIAEYAPAKVKRVITGRGQADKRQVAMMIRTLLSLRELPPPDAADALALAVTHLRLAPVAQALARARGGAAPIPRRARGRPRRAR